jgi:C1A family cysteine protease
MSGSAVGTPTIEVDLRGKFPPLREQGARATCLACSTSDVHQFVRPLPHALSAEYLFHAASLYETAFDSKKGLLLSSAQKALESDGQPHDDEWPLSKEQPDPWHPPPVTTLWRARLKQRNVGPTDIVDHIQRAIPVVVAIKLTAEFLARGPSAVLAPSGSGFGGHAIVAVGYGTLKRAGYLLIRNSWGPAWKDNGHAWLPVAYLNDKLMSYAVVISL